ncbi:MAG: hypothetical protein PUF51_06030 [Bifidobacteriaceae bacterium]|nr:hypothetical protein [Bifidobacteriaceae bacterium]
MTVPFAACGGTSAQDAASTQASAESASSSQSVQSSLSAASSTSTPSASPATTSSAADTSASASISAAAEPSQQDLQAIVDQLEATKHIDTYNTEGLKADDAADTPLIQAYASATEEVHPQGPNGGYTEMLALDGTWLGEKPDGTTDKQITPETNTTSAPDELHAVTLRNLGAPDGVGAPTTGGQWAHREWDGYQAIWKSTDTNYWLYIRQI